MKKKRSLSQKEKKPSKRKERAERMKIIMETTGMKKKTIQNIVWLTKRIPPELRHFVETLSYKHLAAVATLHPDDQKAVLEAAEKNNWTAEYTGFIARRMKSEIEGNDKWVSHEVEKIKGKFRKIADEYRDWDILKEVVEAIDTFVAKEFEVKATTSTADPPSETPGPKP